MASATSKIDGVSTTEICAQFPLSDAGRVELDANPLPGPFLDSLISHSLYEDAVQFLARALPKREAVWWSCVCVRALLPVAGRPDFEAGVKAAEEWVYKPNEENRRKAEQAANAIADNHPARWAAMAAFWSGGSLAPAEAQEVKPGDDLTPKAVAGAIMVTAALDHALTDARNKQFLDSGRDIVRGGSGRPSAAA